jgi:phosphatidylglycerophosphate synthase
VSVTEAVRRPAATESLRATVERLAGAQKGAVGAPAYSRFVNRRLGRLLAAVAFHVGLTPNVVTALSAACTATGVVLVALVPPSGWLALVVGGCLVLGYALDSADGQLARLRGGGSPAGEWLDHMVDAAKSSGLHLAVLVGWFRFGPEDPVWLLVPVGYCLVDAVTYFATMLNEALRAQHGAPTRARPGAQHAGVGRSLLTLPTDYGLLACAFFLLGAPSVFVPVYTALFLAAATFLAAASVKWFREMDRLTR